MSPLRIRLAVESLEGRALPSALLGAPSVHPAALTASAPGPAFKPWKGGGSYATGKPRPDTGVRIQLSGHAAIPGTGSFFLRGQLHGVGNIQNGQATGTLTLFNAHGTLTVQLTGFTQDAFAPVLTVWRFQVTAGTGVYKHFASAGRLMLTLHAGHNGTGQFDFTAQPYAPGMA